MIIDWEKFWEYGPGKIKGWLNSWEGKKLYELALKKKNNIPCVEIGCYFGRSTICLLKGLINSKAKPKLYSIDLFQDAYTFDGTNYEKASEEKLIANISQYTHMEDIKILKGDSKSLDIINKITFKTDFLFVDGDHCYNSLIREWELWKNKLTYGAIVIYHDYRNCFIPNNGVTRFCDEILRPNFKSIEICDRFLREPNSIPGGLFIGYGYLGLKHI